MARLTLTIDSDNAAFADGYSAAFEVARILRETVPAVRACRSTSPVRVSRVLRDVNGNRCGTWEFETMGSDSD